MAYAPDRYAFEDSCVHILKAAYRRHVNITLRQKALCCFLKKNAEGDLLTWEEVIISAGVCGKTAGSVQ